MELSQSALLQQWNEAQEKLKELKVEEMKLRKRIFSLFFPNAVEGANTYDLANGYKLKGTSKITRKIDEAALEAVMAKMPRGSVDHLIKFKPSLVTKNYKALLPAQKKIIDEAIISSPGSPTISIVEPKKE